MSNGVVILIGRFLLAVIFILAGFSKLADPAGTAAYMQGVGLPWPAFTAWAVSLFELVAGLFVLVGYRTAAAATLLGLFSIAAGFIGHWDPGNVVEMQILFKDIAIGGGLLVLAAAGPGRIALDRRPAG
ncbi:DoxX family protein [Aquibium sp. A9E412]|uniref:DoxX family protein n=1 Tax=Aquibium sp. A9E412 TaxID=2976767 RepID=UPI0025B156F8|nr:DoxX family protein [Aquibium sp. A9E412]MDN2568380.1 DoxX family protein [Aquibium sp. A9E412]